MYLSVSGMLRRTVQSRANDIASVFGDRQQTWAELLKKTAHLAGGLKNLGLTSDERIATIMDNSDRYMETALATAWAGGVFTPLNGRWSVPELLDAMEDSTPSILMVDDSNLEAGKQLADAYWKSNRKLKLIYCGEKECPENFESYVSLCKSEPIEDAGRAGDDLFTIFYTGGTTGRSKGVMLSHTNLVACCIGSMAEGHFSERGTYLNMCPTFHLSSMWPFMACVCSGAPSIVLPGFVPADVLKAVEKHKVTEMLLVPTMIQMLIEDPIFSETDTSSMIHVLYGAAPITEALLDRALESFSSVEFVQVYGMTELSPLATSLPSVNLSEEGRRLGRNKSVGRATFGVEVDIVDEDNNPVPRGTVGQITVRGDNRMLGYWNRPEETKAAIKDGWMLTGDGGYMDEDGFVYMVDRIKDMIISGGENIYSVEVENCVAQHPAVAQCAVVGVPDEKWGERVQACVILHPGAKATEQEIIDHCRDLIAHYKCPRSVVYRDAFPLSGAGKVLKREMREEYAPG